MERGTAGFFRTALIKPVLLLTGFIVPVVSHAQELPHEFTANYALEMHGAVLARATYKLEHTDNGVSMTQSTRPSGLVALLRDDKIDVRSDMIVTNGQLLLVNYDYTHTGDEKDRNVSVKINWQPNHKQELVGKATGMYEGRKVDIVIDQPVWDPLSIQVPVMTEAGKKIHPHKYGLFIKGEFKYYLFESHGSEVVKLNGTQISAIKVSGRETERNRAIYMWMAPELNNIPVKIEQWKNDDLKSTVLLESVTFNDDGRHRTLTLKDNPPIIK